MGKPIKEPRGRESPLIVVTQLEGPVEGQHGTCQVRGGEKESRRRGEGEEKESRRRAEGEQKEKKRGENSMFTPSWGF